MYHLISNISEVMNMTCQIWNHKKGHRFAILLDGTLSQTMWVGWECVDLSRLYCNRLERARTFLFGGNEVPKFALAWYMHQCSSYVVTMYNVHVAITCTLGVGCSNCYSTHAKSGLGGLKITQNIAFQQVNLNVSGIKARHRGLYT